MSKQEEQWITTGQSASWDEEAELTGVYVRMKTNIGTHSSNVYVIRKEDDSEMGVWGSTVINGRFSEIPMGSKVRIKALGEVKSKTGAKYKDYLIQYIPPKGYRDVQETFGTGEPLPDDMPPEFTEE